MYVCMDVFTYVFTYIYVYVYGCINVRTYLCMNVCVADIAIKIMRQTTCKDKASFADAFTCRSLPSLVGHCQEGLLCVSMPGGLQCELQEAYSVNPGRSVCVSMPGGACVADKTAH